VGIDPAKVQFLTRKKRRLALAKLAGRDVHFDSAIVEKAPELGPLRFKQKGVPGRVVVIDFEPLVVGVAGGHVAMPPDQVQDGSGRVLFKTPALHHHRVPFKLRENVRVLFVEPPELFVQLAGSHMSQASMESKARQLGHLMAPPFSTV
jgi:hypothetical protein